MDAGSRLDTRYLLRRPAAWLPLLMSVAALAVIGWYLVLYGPVSQPDEGLHAHLWQLLMTLQLPLVAYFAYSWLPRAPRPATVVIGLQLAAAALLGFLPLALLGGL
jgi:hypothetical protein